MVRVEGLPEGPAGQHFRLGQGVPQTGHGAHLLPLQHRLGEAGLLQHQTHDLQGAIPGFPGRQGAQAQAGPVLVGTAAQVGAQVGQAVGNGGLVQVAGTAVEQAVGEAGQARLAGRVPGTAGGKVHLHVHDGQGMVFDEIDPGAGGGDPVLDGDPGLGGRAQQGGGKKQEIRQSHHGLLDQWRTPAGARRRGASARGWGSSRPTVRLSSLKYCLATRCTSAAVTAWSFSIMRSTDL